MCRDRGVAKVAEVCRDRGVADVSEVCHAPSDSGTRHDTPLRSDACSSRVVAETDPRGAPPPPVACRFLYLGT